MSIATLRKKTMNGNPRISPISGNSESAFSINGTRRNSGNVGKTNLARNLNYGENSKTCTNDSNIIKSSVINTKGMLASKKKNCSTNGTCIKPLQWVQPIDTGYNKFNTQSQYIERKHSESACNVDLSNNKINSICNNNCEHKYIGSRNVFRGGYTKQSNTAISQEEYIKTRYLKNKCIPVPENLKETLSHFPPNVNNDNCAIIYKTQQEYYQ